jgi:hypothetical protein
MMKHKAFIKKMFKQPEVKSEYDAQAEEFALLDELLKARRAAFGVPQGVPPSTAHLSTKQQ